MTLLLSECTATGKNLIASDAQATDEPAETLLSTMRVEQRTTVFDVAPSACDRS